MRCVPAFELKECSTLPLFEVLHNHKSLSRLGLPEDSRALLRAELEQIPTACKVRVAHWGRHFGFALALQKKILKIKIGFTHCRSGICEISGAGMGGLEEELGILGVGN